MTSRHRRGRGPARATVLVAATVVLAACGVPVPPEVPDTSGPRSDGADPVDRLVPQDERADALLAALGTLGERIAEARELLAREDAAAVGVLLGAPGGGEAPGVLPAVEPDRAGLGSDDLVTAVITLAGDVGGEQSRLVLELVRDPMLGDLGAWQRDPVGVIALLRATVEGEPADGDPGDPVDPGALDAALQEVPGELSRALGYAFVVASTDDPTLAAHAATQGAGRLGVVLVALDLAVERLGSMTVGTDAAVGR